METDSEATGNQSYSSQSQNSKKKSPPKKTQTQATSRISNKASVSSVNRKKLKQPVVSNEEKGEEAKSLFSSDCATGKNWIGRRSFEGTSAEETTMDITAETIIAAEEQEVVS